MQGNIMQFSLLTHDIIRKAVERSPDQLIVSRTLDGDVYQYTYADAYQRIQRLANGLTNIGVKTGQRIGTLAWSHYQHLECYYAISGIGAVVHPINVRLFPEQIKYIINHAEDQYLFIDPEFIPLVEKFYQELPSVKGYIVNCTQAQLPQTRLSNVIAYEQLLSEQQSYFDWQRFDSRQAASLCYTSGTTGYPKGVLADHYACVLHATVTGSSQFLDLSPDTSALPAVPMYHVCAWGLPFSAILYGCKLVMPGSRLDGASLYQLIEQQQVDKAFGVPTIWQTFYHYLQETDHHVPSLKLIAVGGATSPPALVEAYAKEYNIYWMGLWGMTETGPLATSAAPTPRVMELPLKERIVIQSSAGQPIFGIEIEIFDDNNKPLAHNGDTCGYLKVKGPWVVERYFNSEVKVCDDNGWFDTGDIATIDKSGYLRIIDRSKDLIKSGGEWISSAILENAALHDSAIQQACVVAAKHPKWGERPIMLIVVKPDQSFDKNQLRAVLAEHVASWWLPDAIIQVAELPLTGTGKLRKVELRKQYQNYLLI
ncbi:long-chain fatty acid--CoA ligase [Endozoicomonas sp. SM1973]|uniref:Long-chain fatty acid--CoA ligase n=1 Tax=Spartinivicinus marinus TaxID=2994442 RepID=A0A853HYC6_9GAMM|nr:long-chain fatty acid--CoA ligase [Spartinivicinus marinus]MCX4026905.1 long-chain fatty acid--CoA ligase [Spartinivicinus marinus]NYZ66750.1 long-chain fatty acid--CoA ligase [Spartinivicinus marinus]